EGARLEELLSSDPQSRAYYLEFMELHGALQWGAAGNECTTVPPTASMASAAETILPTAVSEGLGPSSASTSTVIEPPASVVPCTSVSGQAKRLFFWRKSLSTPRFSLAMSIAVLLLAFTVVAAGERIIRAVFWHSMEAHPSGGLLRNSKNRIELGASPR